ncbi:EamA family transporter [uncultured Paracoccus sp.]|uniref:EamA family transporter n=1 Tax=uncultured Paracoccus sp. TaxID=189685 RepID=UPI0025F86D46|nr:EamA family transporter [uncultured Paracoccus sp.]
MSTHNAGRFMGTAIGPMLWGTTYVVFVQTLPTDYPLLISALRALPAGLLMLLFVRRLPSLRILFPVTVLALTNIGVFFALLLISAARLPGGITATLAACQPLLVALLAWPLLGLRPGAGRIALAVLGMAGVGLMVLNGGLAYDLTGVLAGIGAALSMALGIVLMERWRNLAPPRQMATWQLLIGGALLLPVALLVEGLPTHWDSRNTLGLGYLTLFVTALGYWLWVSGVQRLGSRVSVLAFLSPVVALVLGIGVMQETLNAQQILGVAMVFLSIGLTLKGRG